MRLTIRLACILSLAAAGLAAPAAAQREDSHIVHNDDHRIISNRDGHRLEIHMRGAVDFNDAGNWVIAVPADGLFTIEERNNGERRLEFRPGQGGPRVRYFVNDDERPLDAAGRAWAQRHIERAVRESGFGAERRVARIRARSGVSGVLADMAPLRSDVARRNYYRALLRGGSMSTGEFTRVMEDVGRRMGSDVETRLVLIDASAQAGEGARLAALLRAAQGIDSDVETRLVLTHVAGRHRLSAGAVRDAFFRAVGGLGSDVERRLVLTAVLDERLADGASREAFFRAVSEFDSDVERRIVLSELLRGDAPEATVIAAIHSAGEMNSDVEKRIVLSAVPSAHLRSQRVVAAYRRVAQEMGSNTERQIVLRRLDGRR
jgi:hypothetical protein